MADIEEQIEKLGQDRKELKDLMSRVAGDKAQFTQTMLYTLLEIVEQALGKLFVQSEKAQYFDKDLGGNIKSTITEVLTAISNIKAPEVNVAVDLKPIQSAFASEIAKQNALIIPLIQKLNSNGVNDKSDALYKLIVQMVEKNNAFIETVFKNPDYSGQLDKISKGVNQEQNVEYIGKITKRNNGLIDEWYMKPK